ncbi:hypothetical protein KIL84_013684 [Mauremys mutica]|uniref:Uncharacterized protein n=1 Tax=Mauremys mutica TaxID=74926 RepID=A0A9D4ASN6_9SAUR|nr:hypothetical protein KIL84_013684 [Mauremys mutica]
MLLTVEKLTKAPTQSTTLKRLLKLNGTDCCKFNCVNAQPLLTFVMECGNLGYTAGGGFVGTRPLLLLILYVLFRIEFPMPSFGVPSLMLCPSACQRVVSG